MVHGARQRRERICLGTLPGLAEVIDSDFDAVVRMLMMARWLQAGAISMTGWNRCVIICTTKLTTGARPS